MIQLSSQYNSMLKVFGLQVKGMPLGKAKNSWIMDGAEKLCVGSLNKLFCIKKLLQIESKEDYKDKIICWWDPA